jgi:amino-acid N-acetyltransferase
MGTAINIENFSTDDEEKVLALLKGADLPVDDLTEEKMKNFIVARNKEDRIIGVVGVELHLECGLLRSLAVHPAYRGTGLGKRLTHKIESLAGHNGIKILYLLTMTAADFFQKIGYEVTHRDRVPQSIRETQEFKNLCPVSAVCLSKLLDSV